MRPHTQHSAIWLALAALLFFAGAAHAQTAVLSASRGEVDGETDVAPLAVFFDGLGTTCTGWSANCSDPFHDLTYEFDFGDPTSGTWATSGLSKDSQTGGPTAGHVYDSDGTYTVTLKVRDDAGTTATDTTTIYVDDPDTVYATTSTYCFYNSTLGTGCPTGATQVQTSLFDIDDAQGVLSYVAAGRRLLMKRGDTFAATDDNRFLSNAGPVTIGDYGSGDLPLVTSDIADDYATIELGSTPYNGCDDWRIMNIRWEESNGTADVVYQYSLNDNILIYGNEVDGHSRGFVTNLDVVICHADHESLGTPMNLAYVENSIEDNSGSWQIYGGSDNLMVMGNTLSNANGGSHTLRLKWSQRGFIGHNFFDGAADDKHLIKLYHVNRNRTCDDNCACDDTDTEWQDGEWTEYNVIADNNFNGSGDTDYPLEIGPQGSSQNYGNYVRHTLIERNFFYGNTMQRGIYQTSPLATIRNNIFTSTLSGNGEFIHIDRRGGSAVDPPDPDDVHIYNNTAYRVDYRETPLVNVASSDVHDAVIMGNVWYMPAGSGTTIVENAGTDTVQSDNVSRTTSYATMFVEASPTDPADFMLHSSNSLAIDTGVALPGVERDYGSRLRDNSVPDIGAWAYTTVAEAGETCGDGTIEGAEECDDSDTDPGDGCSASCVVETNWTCTGEPSVCTECGGGTVDGAEACDDDGVVAGDGCSATCTVEANWTCVGSPSVCTECGDGTVNGAESCDDGGVVDGDGCSSTCQVETEASLRAWCGG